MEITEITGDNFQTEVTGAGVPVLLEFYADGCESCKAQFSVLKKAASDACDVKFCRIHVEREPGLTAGYGVGSVPAMVVLNGEQIFRTITGFHSLEEILEYLEM